MRAAPLAALGIGLLPLAAMAPDALATLAYARRTGKRFDDGWRRITEDGDKHFIARRAVAGISAADRIGVHRSMHPDWSLEWALGRPFEVSDEPPSSGEVRFLDARFTAPNALIRLASSATVTAWGPYWVAVPGPTQLVSWRLTRREPDFWRWYWVDGTEPVYGVEPDPFGTWELRRHLGQAPNPPPGREPQTTDELRIAHAVALARGDGVAAEGYLQALLSRLDQTPRTAYVDGSELIGFELDVGVTPRLRLYLRASPEPTGRHLELRVVSRVDHRPWSTVAAPRHDREVGMPFAIPSELFLPGEIYVADSELRRQPGIDVYSAELIGSAAPAPVRGPRRIPLFALR